jgi:stage V sporulation protein G
MRGFASICLDNCFIIRDLVIIDGSKGYTIRMPQTVDQEGKVRDICYPTDLEFRNKIELAILTKFEEKLKSNAEYYKQRNNPL